MRMSIGLSVTPEELQTIDESRGQKSRSAFIRETVECRIIGEKLAEIKKKHAVKEESQ